MLQNKMQINNLNFKPVHWTSLEIGKKYVIKKGSKIFGPWYQYVGTLEKNVDDYLTFSSVVLTDLKTNYTQHKDSVMIHSLQPYTYYILDPQKYKIQDEMELRAVNRVLQNVVGDIEFCY